MCCRSRKGGLTIKSVGEHMGKNDSLAKEFEKAGDDLTNAMVSCYFKHPYAALDPNYRGLDVDQVYNIYDLGYGD